MSIRLILPDVSKDLRIRDLGEPSCRGLSKKKYGDVECHKSKTSGYAETWYVRIPTWIVSNISSDQQSKFPKIGGVVLQLGGNHALEHLTMAKVELPV